MQEWKHKCDSCDMRKQWRWDLKNVNDLKRNTCQSEDNMKKTLIKLKSSKNNSHECENDTCESNMWKWWQLRKLNKIEIQMQQSEGDYPQKCKLTVDMS